MMTLLEVNVVEGEWPIEFILAGDGGTVISTMKIDAANELARDLLRAAFRAANPGEPFPHVWMVQDFEINQ